MHWLSPRRARRRDALAAAAGLGFGFLTGFVVRSLVGHLGRDRVRHLVSRLPGLRAAAPPPGATAHGIEAALRAVPEFHALDLEVVPVRAGHVELHGWVPSRAAGARALRAAAAAAPSVEVTNRLRVRGEDDLGPAPRAAEERQPA